MNRGVLAMSNREIERLRLIDRVISGGLSQARAAAMSGLSGRHFRRLQGEVRQKGPEGVVSRRRGKPSNRRLPEEVRQCAINLVRNHYRDFGPTFAHEKLFENHRHEFSMGFSVETLRKWMTEEQLWQGRGRSPARVHQSRERRSRFGELIQIDGSPHDWFEGRRPPCTLIAFIDDATSMVTHWRFCEAESTFAYMQCLEGHLREHGVPVSIYSDRHSIFNINAEEKCALRKETQLARAFRQLGIEPILATTPQAKGRIERLFKTLQDRLVKELRIHRIGAIEQANAFLENYRDVFNRKFSKKPANPSDAHRKLKHSEKQLKLVLSKHYERTLSKNLICQHDNTQYMVKTKNPCYSMRGAKVTLCIRPDGKVVMLYKRREVACLVHAQGKRLPETAGAKEVSAKVDLAAARRLRRCRGHKPAVGHPWKRWKNPCQGPIPQPPQ